MNNIYEKEAETKYESQNEKREKSIGDFTSNGDFAWAPWHLTKFFFENLVVRFFGALTSIDSQRV